MKKSCQFHYKANQKAFTLIELLIVMAIVSFLASVFLPTLQEARAKGEDARRVGSLKSLQNEVMNQTNAGTTPFTNVFTSGAVATKISKFSNDTGLVARTDFSGSTVTGDFDAFSDTTSFVVVAPLKTDPNNYWCIDSNGNSKQVSGRLTSGVGPKSCGDATVSTGSTSSSNSSVLGMTGTQPKGIVIDSLGNILTSNIGDNTVTKLSPSGSLIWTASTGNAPMEIAVDSLDNVYTINSATNTVTKITSGGVSTLSFANTGSAPVSMVIDSLNNLYVGNMNSLTISKINTTTGATIGTFSISSAPHNMVVNNSGNLYVASGTEILEVDTVTGVSTVYAVVNLNTSMLVLDSSGFLYIVGTQIGNPTLYEAKIVTTPTNVIDLPPLVDSYPHDITVDSADNLYVSISPNAGAQGHVQQITQSGVSSIFGTTDNDPWGIAIDGSGNIYTANLWSNNVSKLTP